MIRRITSFGTFQQFNAFNRFTVLFELYNPYINYTWSNTSQVANKMYSKNIGNSGADLQLFSGQGVKFNGTNQSIVVPVNATILTEIKRVKGSVVLNTAPQVITNYVIGTGSTAVHTDYFLFTDVLTQQEIELYTNNPNKFFQDTRDGVIDNCVLNMPLHGVDKYQVDYSRFSLLEYPYNNVRTGYTNVNYIAPIVSSSSIVNSKLRISDNGTTTNTPRFLLASNKSATTKNILIPGKYYMVEVKIYSVSSIVATPSIYIRYDTDHNLNGGLTIVKNLCDLKPHTIMFKSINGGGVGALLNDTGTSELTSYFDVEYFIVTEISGINEVLNYTADCVTGAKQLPYGSQEANFFHKSSGVPIRTGLSPFFESTPYWGNYGDTGWKHNGTIPLILEIILEPNNSHMGNQNMAIVVDALTRYIKIGGTTVSLYGVQATSIECLQVVFNGITFSVYINGVYKGISPSVSGLSCAENFFVGARASSTTTPSNNSNALIRHFKVITDAKTISTYNALTEYNKLVAKGLLANFVLDENGDYMQDEFGNYIMDI